MAKYSKEGLTEYFRQFLNGDIGLARAEILADLFMIAYNNGINFREMNPKEYDTIKQMAELKKWFEKEYPKIIKEKYKDVR